MQLFYQPNISKGDHLLTEEESRHAVKVLRLKEGDQIDLTDGLGCFYKALITEPHQKRCAFEIVETKQVASAPLYRHIAIAPTKNIDRLEWFVEKAVEFGVDRITPMLCDHSERRIVKIDRLRKKAISAMKQSIKAFMPQIDELTKFDQMLSYNVEHKFIAYVDPENHLYLKESIQKNGHHLVLIGPEGDFSTNEISRATQAHYKKVSLGTSRLRTETAGIAAIHLLNL